MASPPICNHMSGAEDLLQAGEGSHGMVSCCDLRTGSRYSKTSVFWVWIPCKSVLLPGQGFVVAREAALCEVSSAILVRGCGLGRFLDPRMILGIVPVGHVFESGTGRACDNKAFMFEPQLHALGSRRGYGLPHCPLPMSYHLAVGLCFACRSLLAVQDAPAWTPEDDTKCNSLNQTGCGCGASPFAASLGHTVICVCMCLTLASANADRDTVFICLQCCVVVKSEGHPEGIWHPATNSAKLACVMVVSAAFLT